MYFEPGGGSASDWHDASIFNQEVMQNVYKFEIKLVHLVLIAFCKLYSKEPWCLLRSQEFIWEKWILSCIAQQTLVNIIETQVLPFEPNWPVNVCDIEKVENVFEESVEDSRARRTSIPLSNNAFHVHQRDWYQLLAQKFYELEEGTNDISVCACDRTRKHQQNWGWGNLVDHMKRSDQEELDVLNTTSTTASSSTQLFWYSKATQVNACMSMVEQGLEPFSFVEQNAIRRHCKQEPISIKYMQLHTRHDKQKIAYDLPSKFAIVLDCWTLLSAHYLVVFASFPSKTECGYDSCLISFSPFRDETNFSATELNRFLEFILSKYQTNFSSVVSLISTNTVRSKNVGRKWPLIILSGVTAIVLTLRCRAY